MSNSIISKAPVVIFNGLSKTRQNDIIQSINSVITVTVKDEVKSIFCFSWQVDVITGQFK
jgi:hypothetical protein